VYAEPFPRHVRGIKDGREVVASDRVQLVHRAGTPPAYAFPVADVRLDSARPEPELPGFVQVPWDDVDEWYEERERIFGHPRNPYHRVDCLDSDRRLRIRVAGQVLVDTTTTVALFETGLDPRLYVAPALVRTELLVRSETTTYCPYKGTATHWTVRVGDHEVADAAWSYEDPLPESHRIKGMLSFYTERAEIEQDASPSR
jgi:uncharacterized protein (DUF427 family)